MRTDAPSVVYAVERAVDYLAQWNYTHWDRLDTFRSVSSAQSRLGQAANSLWQRWTYEFPRCEIKLKYDTPGEARVLINGDICARFRVAEQYVKP